MRHARSWWRAPGGALAIQPFFSNRNRPRESHRDGAHACTSDTARGVSYVRAHGVLDYGHPARGFCEVGDSRIYGILREVVSHQPPSGARQPSLPGLERDTSILYTLYSRRRGKPHAQATSSIAASRGRPPIRIHLTRTRGSIERFERAAGTSVGGWGPGAHGPLRAPKPGQEQASAVPESLRRWDTVYARRDGQRSEMLTAAVPVVLSSRCSRDNYSVGLCRRHVPTRSDR